MIVAGQLYVFTRSSMLEDDVEGVLGRMAEAGYEAIEGMLGRPPIARDVVDAVGLRYLAPHCGLRNVEPLSDTIRFCRAMGAEAICSSGLLTWDKRSGDDYRASAEALNRIGAKLQAEGIELLYHNHDFEFLEVEPGKTGMDLLLESLDSRLVRLCFDAGWVWVAGHDPAQFLAEHGEKIGLLHMRDFLGRESVPLGQGDMELTAVCAEAAKLPNLRALVVEQDPTTPDPMGDMVKSRTYLRDTHGI